MKIDRPTQKDRSRKKSSPALQLYTRDTNNVQFFSSFPPLLHFISASWHGRSLLAVGPCNWLTGHAISARMALRRPILSFICEHWFESETVDTARSFHYLCVFFSYLGSVSCEDFVSTMVNEKTLFLADGVKRGTLRPQMGSLMG